MAKLGTFELDGSTNILKGYKDVHYDILWAEMGIAGNLQKYVVKVTKSAMQTEITFNPPQRMNIGVSFQFKKVGDPTSESVAPSDNGIFSGFSQSHANGLQEIGGLILAFITLI